MCTQPRGKGSLGETKAGLHQHLHVPLTPAGRPSPWRDGSEQRSVASAVFPEEEALPLGELGPSRGVLPLPGEPSQLRSALLCPIGHGRCTSYLSPPSRPQLTCQGLFKPHSRLEGDKRSLHDDRKWAAKEIPTSAGDGDRRTGSVRGAADPLAAAWDAPAGLPPRTVLQLPAMSMSTTGCTFSTPPALGWRGPLHGTGPGPAPTPL